MNGSARWSVPMAGLMLLPLLVAPVQPAPDSAPPIEGLWVSQHEFGNAAHGPLTVTLHDTRGRAEIGGQVATFETQADSIRFTLADGAGGFRGRIERNIPEIRGFWIQPPSTGKDGPFGQAYATPLRLAAAGTGRYSGTLTPLPARFTLYLFLWSDSTGWHGAFRNPQFNLTGGAPRFRIRNAADSLYFSAKFLDPSQPEVNLSARWDGANSIVRMPWQGLESPAVFTRADSGQAAGFWPRLPGTKHPYRVPESDRDGWTTARASTVGMDEDALARFTQCLADTNPVGSRTPLVHACLVERHGRLVYEEYFYGHHREAPHDLRSASKTFASVLVGTAMRQRAPISAESPVYSLMASRGPFASPDPRRVRITLGHLMTHTSGLACDDNDENSPGGEWAMQQSSEDWWKHTLDLPVEYEPGSHYAYCSGGMNLVGGAISAATGRWLPEYFDSSVARPLDFGRYFYNLMPTGDGYLGGGIHLRPRDLLKLGRLYLDGGVWHGQRIVDSTWVQLSTIDQVPDSTRAEGYAWHLDTLRRGDRTYRAFGAAGNGGQLLIVLPELDMSVVFTGGNYMMYGIWRNFRDDLVPNRILAAIRDH